MNNFNLCFTGIFLPPGSIFVSQVQKAGNSFGVALCCHDVIDGEKVVNLCLVQWTMIVSATWLFDQYQPHLLKLISYHTTTYDPM